jgi:type II secretory pathway component GspD/PulD (secretin)
VCLAAFFALSFSAVVHAEEIASVPLDLKLQKHISLDLRDMNVVDVYKFLAIKGDFNISISKTIKGRVTLFLSDVTIKDTLDIITIANGLGYKYVGDNIVHVMTEDEYQTMYGARFGDTRKVKIVYLKYAKPAYVLEALKNIKSEIGKVVIDSDTGSLVLIDTKHNIKEMEEAIEKIDHPLEMKVYKLQYADAEETAKKLRKELDNKSVGSVEPDARSNNLIVKAFPGRMKEIEAMIVSLDVKTKAVLIEVKILKVKLNPKLDIGVDWETIFKEAKSLTFKGSFPIASTITDFLKIGVGNINVNDWQASLKLSKQIMDTKVLANPSIMVVNNKEARIHIGDKLAYVTTTTIGAGDTQRTNEEIHYIDVGVQFKVTPTINDDGVITMQIVPEISSKTGELITPQGAKVPLINSTLVETSVIVSDGQTIVIGGLKESEFNNKRNGMPYLMDIPVVGGAFRTTTNDNTRTEIVILLTPHIVGNKENYVDRENAKDRTVMPDKAY